MAAENHSVFGEPGRVVAAGLMRNRMVPPRLHQVGRLPADLQAAISRAPDRPALGRRGDIAELGRIQQARPQEKGITFINSEQNHFREALGATSFFAGWTQQHGGTAWDLLEKASGKLG